MKKIMHDIQRCINRCINRFEFALLIYTPDKDQERFYSVLTNLEDLLKNDLVNIFRKYWVTEQRK